MPDKKGSDDRAYARGFAAARAAATPDPDATAVLAAVKAIIDEPLDERDGHGPTRTGQFARIDALLRDRPTTADAPEPIEYECELCGGRLDGPYEKCGSAQHGPNGTVIYGRAVPVSPIPDSEFTGNPWRDAFPPGRLDAPLKAEAYEQGWDNGRAAENARIVAALRAKGTHAADVLADQIEREAP